MTTTWLLTMENQEKVRLDKWLWAARFFKTRALAKAAIEGGKVHWDGQRVKPGKIVQLGDALTIRQGFDEKEVTVERLLDKRGSAPIAQTMYTETAASIKKREEARALRQAAGIKHERKPDKKQRRQIHRFKRINQSD